MAILARLILYVILPGLVGFTVSYILVIPLLVPLIAGIPGAGFLVIAATGLLTFALASVLRGSLQRLRANGPTEAA